LKSFDDLPLLDVQTQMNNSKKNTSTEILFPTELAGQNICFLVGDEIAYFTPDNRGMVVIKNKELVKTLNRK